MTAKKRQEGLAVFVFSIELSTGFKWIKHGTQLSWRGYKDQPIFERTGGCHCSAGELRLDSLGDWKYLRGLKKRKKGR